MNLSIIIPNWNTSKVTIECLKSIYAHIKSIKFEVIVVDNASTDDSVSRISKRFPQVILIQNKSNLGFSKANNIGAKRSKGEFILFLNSDMKLSDDNLILMMKYIQDNKDVGLIGPKFLNPDMTPQASVFPPQTPLNAIREFWFHQQGTYSKLLPSTLAPTNVWAISGGCVLIRTTLFQSIGGWNEKYAFYFEDLELCRTIRRLNLRIIYFPKMLVIHYHGLSGRKVADTSNQWRRLIPGSKLYHGHLEHMLISLIIWLGQKFRSPKST